ncbi:MAG: Mrp/NBP35 family ATP-binding protein [Candidatus Methanomethyliaceae archaeon]|nr:Mrp/NBP35 family ATP-binding protein [Candidatus Methanomethyliaceae archaeon]MDW7970785.1 Mrp/NBP35 family ATP-binding protein [Nitrososphaerota archaeon]
MINKDDVIKILRKVVDPELGMDLVEANMVRDVEIYNGTVKITIALTSSSCPLMDKIKSEILNNVKNLQGVNEVEVITTTMSEDEVRKLFNKIRQRRMFQKLPKRNIKRIIAILSGKGGVGKSSITALLATALIKRKLKIGVLDADITGPSIPKIFGINSIPYVLEGKIIPPVSKTGIKIMSMNLIIGDEELPVIWRGPLVSNAITQFYMNVDWGELDYLIVDLPPGTSDAQLTVMQSLPLDGVIIVTSPQELAGIIVSKAVNMSMMLGVTIIGVIENMSYVKCPNCGKEIRIFGDSKGKLLAEKMNTKFLGSVPIDPVLSNACDNGTIEDYNNEEIWNIIEKALDMII